VGDQALRVVAATIQGNLRKSDRIARVGGDEFVVLLPRVSFASAQQVFDKLRDKVRQAMHDHAWPVTLSIGAVTYDRPDLDGQTMLKETDRLMYESKAGGRNRIQHIHRSAGRVVSLAANPG
jgi:diguanylate cyclase (GGDEF)-like protein